MPSRTDTLPWYKQFWPWFVIALPMTAVIGGVATIFIAMGNPDALVVDDYYKAGLAINETLGREQLAADKGLSALVRHNPETRRVQLELNAAQAPDARLEYLDLKLIHPTLDEMDQLLRLRLENNNIYVSEISEVSAGSWHLIVTPPDGSWRLTGRLKMPQGGQARLTPGV